MNHFAPPIDVQSTQEYKDAFDEIVAERFENNNNEETSSLQEELETDEPTGNLVQADEPADLGIGYEPSQQETVLDKPKRGRPPKSKTTDVDTSVKNFEEEYNKLKQDYEAKVGLLNSRLSDVSAKYQELKVTSKKEEQPEQYPETVSEAFELYPELQEAINYLIDSKVNKVKENLKPLEEFSTQQAQQQMIAPIMEKHPDVLDIVNSGELNVWANGLPPIERNGAFIIIDRGSPEEIIALLDRYKQDKGSNSNEQTSTSQMGQLPSSSRNQNPQGRTEQTVQPNNGLVEQGQIVNKVLAALSVPSNREPINTNFNPTVKEKDFDDFVNDIEKRLNKKHSW